ASDSDITRLGLPETQLGLIPAWGGSTRLPILLGLPTALELIVSGKQLKPRAAKKLGLVDQVLPREHLEAAAREMLARGLPDRVQSLNHGFWKLPGIRQALAHHVRHQVMTKTRGLYQAP